MRSRLTDGEGSADMPQYRIYYIEPDGHNSTPPDVVECADEQEAIGKAAQAANGKAVELWNGPHLIMRFPRDGN
jgi:hypothetical protein